MQTLQTPQTGGHAAPQSSLTDALDREIAGATLQRSARQFARVVDEVAAGDCSQELLRARAASLEAAALDYAVALGYTPPDAPPPTQGRGRGPPGAVRGVLA